MTVALEPSPPAASGDAAPAARPRRAEPLLVYVLLGACFGLALVKSEAASWFRIQ